MQTIIGNKSARELLRRLAAHRRVPGTLLLAGPDGVGKRLCALELAQALNCPRASDGRGCGVCTVCQRILKFTLPAKDDRDAHKRIAWSEYLDVGQIIPYNRAILVDAARDLDKEAHFRPYEGKARVFIIDEAEKFNESSGNALLKTLEEPPSTTHLILLTSRPATLLPTIRSRSQLVRFAPLSAAEIESYLLSEKRATPADAALLARLAEGSLGQVRNLELKAYREQRALMLEVLHAVTVKPNRVRLLRISEELTDAKRKDSYENYLETLTRLAHDIWKLTLGASAEAIVNADAHAQLQTISTHTTSPRAAQWLTSISEHRQRLAVNINRKAATDVLLLGLS